MPTRIFLDTCTLNALSGKEDAFFERLRILLEKNNMELWSSHVQADTLAKKYPNYEEILELAVRKFEEHGIKINRTETKGALVGFSRVGYSTVVGDEVGKIYDELKSELERCMIEKGKLLDDKTMNGIHRDCLIALTSTDYDYFITCDDCLHRSLKKILKTNEDRIEKQAIVLFEETNEEKILHLLETLVSSC